MSFDPNFKLIKPVVDGDNLHYQTEPYLSDGELVIKRLATIPIKIIDPLWRLKWDKSFEILERMK